MKKGVRLSKQLLGLKFMQDDDSKPTDEKKISKK